MCIRDSPEGWAKYLAALEAGETKVNSSQLYPYELVKAVLDNKGGEAILAAQWAALPNYLGDTPKRILPVVDTSTSMILGGRKPLPLHIAIGLGLYLAERNTGMFK